eukprot:TRINITY_DN18026_c0_g1_i2.p1 TRINITY_DN18026_c0_g1~~TRINITY_DN18026_c0_g1_i2.p1  ORF type:complete len:380 (-),score=62.20 TRINITY_DN18026_c0_g1_i2:586-1725(-)
MKYCKLRWSLHGAQGRLSLLLRTAERYRLKSMKMEILDTWACDGKASPQSIAWLGRPRNQQTEGDLGTGQRPGGNHDDVKEDARSSRGERVFFAMTDGCIWKVPVQDLYDDFEGSVKNPKRRPLRQALSCDWYRSRQPIEVNVVSKTGANRITLDQGASTSLLALMRAIRLKVGVPCRRQKLECKEVVLPRLRPLLPVGMFGIQNNSSVQVSTIDLAKHPTCGVWCASFGGWSGDFTVDVRIDFLEWSWGDIVDADMRKCQFHMHYMIADALEDPQFIGSRIVAKYDGVVDSRHPGTWAARQMGAHTFEGIAISLDFPDGELGCEGLQHYCRRDVASTLIIFDDHAKLILENIRGDGWNEVEVILRQVLTDVLDDASTS